MNFTKHSRVRMNQRAISKQDAQFVAQFGQTKFRTGVRFFFLGRRDIPRPFQRTHGHLEGTTLVTDPAGKRVFTCYQDKGAIRQIKRKQKRAEKRCLQAS